MLEEVWNTYQVPIAILVVLLVFFSVMIVLLFFGALFATAMFFTLPCDQPLNRYFVSSLAVGHLAPWLVKQVLRRPWVRRSPRRILLVSVCGSVPGWTVMAWGFWMVWSCRTCQQTNPHLYYPVKHFIYGQVVLFMLTTVFFSIGFRGVLAYASTLAESPGCQDAVRALPKVPGDAPELLDPTDGTLVDCPICAESFGSELAVVRTPCGHHFHEHCLARWCANHVDCPMCRAPVGEPDAPTPRSGAVCPRPGGGTTSEGPPVMEAV